MMHTIAKASLQADSRIDMFWKSMKIYVKSCRNGSQFGPWCALGSFRGSKITEKLPKAHPKGPQGHPRAPFGTPRGVPRATKSPQRAPRGSPRALLGGLGKGKIEKKLGTQAKKVAFSKSAPRIGRGESRSTLAPPQTAPKSTQNTPKLVPEQFGRPLRSNLVAQERPARPRRLIWIDSDRLKCLRRRFP